MTRWDDLFTTTPTTTPGTATVTPLDPARATKYAHKALTSECEAVANATEGNRNHTLNTAAFSLGQLVAAGHLTHEDTTTALTNAARAAGLNEHEITATLASGLTAGAREPRIVADLPPLEVPNVSILTEPTDHTDPDHDPIARFNLIDWHTLKRTDEATEDWLAEPIIAAGRMVALYSAPKAGKSLLVLEIVAAIALGRPTLGHAAQPPTPVLYVDFENDPRGDIKPRLEDMGYDLDDLQGHLHVATFPNMARLDTPQGGLDLLMIAQHVGARLVVIDTVSRTVGGEENDNNTWLSFYRNTGILLKRESIACLRLDHSGKDRERGMRGGSAKYGDVDAVWKLTAASETVLELECTDHRMPLTTTAFTVVRHTDPLRHDVSGDPFTVAMDAKESDLMATLDRLETPTDWGRDKVRTHLAAAGIKVDNTLLSRVLRARKLVLTAPVPDRSQTGADSRPRNCLSGTPYRGQTADRSDLSAARQDNTPQPPPNHELEQVACRTCYTPIENRLARINDGHCIRCSTAAGPTTQETP